MNRTLVGMAALAALLAACGKAQDAVTQKAVEKTIESAMQKEGSTAKVDLSAGTMKVTATDAAGKTSTTEIGGAQVGEADVGVPFYPGLRPVEGGSTRVTSPDGTHVSVQLRSADAADKVAAFYRDTLKARSAGKQFMDLSGADGGATLMLADQQSKDTVQVHVAKADQGTDVHIVATRATAK